CGVAGSLGLMIVDEGAAFLLLPLEQPITNFKNQAGKLRVVLETRPGAEGLHQPRRLPKIAKITKAMAIVAKRPVKFFGINVCESGFSRGRQRQQYLSWKIILKAIVHLGPAPVGENVAMPANGRPQGFRQPAHLRTAIISFRKLAERKD